MELLPAAAQDNSPGANPCSVKSDDSSPRPDGGRGSPPPNCAICLGTCRNNSFTDSCLHQFCFKCLLTWSKVKAECPLCKQNFRSIIHNVRSNHQYEEYMVEQRVEEVAERIDIDAFTTATRRFRYRTTVTLPRGESRAIEQLLMHYPLVAEALPPRAPPPARRRRSPAAFRRTVYRHNLWARPLPDFTGRFRDCRPDFYRYNDTQMHRLVPWLNRELLYLLNENIGHISYVLSKILDLLPQYHITSSEFREHMHRYLGDRTEHFLHELYCFASTPYDMTGYDRNVQYTTDTRISTMVNEVISSSDSDSVDSDIVMVSSSHPTDHPPSPGPSSSRLPAPVYPQNYIPPPQTDNVIPIETISHSDTDDDSSEVMVVGYIKPPQDRTPEVVDLLGSDSDVIVQDEQPPPQRPPAAHTATQSSAPETSRVSLVKLSLKRHTARAPTSDSDESFVYPMPQCRRPRLSTGSASTRYTASTTPSPRAAAAYSPYTTDELTSSDTLSITANPDLSDTETFSSSGSYMRGVRKRKLERKSRTKKTKEPRSSRSRREMISPGREQATTDTNLERKRKRKSSSGKGVKRSRRTATSPRTGDHEGTPPLPPPPNQPLANDLPQHIHTTNETTTETNVFLTESNNSSVDLCSPSTSGEGLRRHRSNDDYHRRLRKRSSRESRRLRSVVNVMYNRYTSDDSSPSGHSSGLSINNSSVLGGRLEDGTSQDPPSLSSLDSNFVLNMPMARRVEGQSESDDDLPLNLSIQKSFTSL